MRQGLADDRSFYSTLVRLAVPIALQQLVLNALNAVDVLMIGQLGDSSVAAAGLAYQLFFLMSLFLFGVGSGTAIFSAQFWGRGDLARVRQMLGLALMIGVGGSVLFTLAAVLAPETVLGLYSRDPEVVALGSRYLRVVGLSYIPTAITIMYGMVLRSTRQVKLPMAVAMGALSFKTVLAYTLIFGHLGLPAFGMLGAAIATCCARLLECAVILTLTYHWRLPAAGRPGEMFAVDRALVSRFVGTALPVVANEILWSLGITTYTGIYARISTESVTAVSISTTIESVALVPFMGLGNACAIMLGNYIGAGDTVHAFRYSRRFLQLAIGGALLVGALILAGSGIVLDLYRISPVSYEYARRVLLVISLALWLKAANMVMIVGILRSGGDTRFGLFADVGPLWLIGVPLALLGAFVLHLPVYWVVVLVLADEGTKFLLAMWRVLSGRWINNVIHAV